jgi:three-Cys-motif partner protein
LSGIASTTWEIEPHTRAKHVILKRYLSAWFPILSKYSGRIIYLDGFAGPGIYKGGEDGSPVIALQTASEHLLKAHFNEIMFFFIEKEKDRASMLKSVLEKRFPNLPSNIKYKVYDAEFAPTFKQVMDALEKQGFNLAPTFAFLDPFGFSGLPMNLIAKLLTCKKCEVFVTFMAGFVRRFHDELREPALNELFDTDEWKRIHEIDNSDQKEKFIVSLYERQLRKLGGAEYVKSFGMMSRNNQIIYYLVFATKHLKGLEIMKEAMWKVDPTGMYKFSDVTGFEQTRLMDFQSEPHWIQNAAEIVYQHFRGKNATEDEVHKFVVSNTQYIYRKTILKSLEKSRPSKILNVSNRKREFCYPEGCTITFCD